MGDLIIDHNAVLYATANTEPQAITRLPGVLLWVSPPNIDLGVAELIKGCFNGFIEATTQAMPQPQR
jgi:hypothetical protein